MSRSRSSSNFRKWAEVRRSTGYRSQFEVAIAEKLSAEGITADYEKIHLPYSVTLTSTYTPDWILSDQCIVLEAKGEFSKADRDKMELIKSQYPHLDIRMILQTPTAKLNGRKMTQAMWCDAHGFPWCKGPDIPKDWLKHKPGVRSRKAFAAVVAGKG